MMVEAGPPIHADASPFPFRCVYCLGSEEGTLLTGIHVEHIGECPWLVLAKATRA